MRNGRKRVSNRSRRRRIFLSTLAAVACTASASYASADDNVAPFLKPNAIMQATPYELPSGSFREILASHAMEIQASLTEQSEEGFGLTGPQNSGNRNSFELTAPDPIRIAQRVPVPPAVPTPKPDRNTDSVDGELPLPESRSTPEVIPAPDFEFDQIPSSSDFGDHADVHQFVPESIDLLAPVQPAVPDQPPGQQTDQSIPMPIRDDVQTIIDPELIGQPFEAPVVEDASFPVSPAGHRDLTRSFSSTRPALGAVAGSYSATPAMIGDFFGGTFNTFGGHFNSGMGSPEPGNTISVAGGDRRFKVSENVSPKPQDRVFFNYNHFHNALRDVNGENQNLDRFTLGFEKTFFGGSTSFEWRLPFAGGLNSAQTVGALDTQNTELGNIAFAFKTVLKSGRDWVLTGGTTLTLPTGDDFELFNPNLDLVVRNDAVHLAPFLGFLRNPGGKWFFQSFIQADIDLNGNDVLSTNGFEGVLQDQNLLFVDASLGKWLFRNNDPFARVSGVAFITELHYTTTLNDTDQVAGLQNGLNRLDVLNATGALNVSLGRTSLRVGAAAPLRQDEERLFDAEVIFQMNRFF